MAKQNVSFVERHVEKVVVGIAGTALAAVILLYAVQDPYVVEVGGEALGPSAFYNKLDDKASNALARLQGAKPDLSGLEAPVLKGVPRVPTDMPVVIGALNPAVPKAEPGLNLGAKLELVAILPPGKPALTTGRATCAVPAKQVKVIGEAQPPSAVSDRETSQDHHWIAAFAAVPRRAQQEAFMAANYIPRQQQLIVTSIEAERQRLLPGGEWAQPEPVKEPFETLEFICRDTVSLITDNGEPQIAPEDYKLIDTLTTEAKQAQPAILRPDFQASLDNLVRLEWKVPDELPGGIKVDWLDDFQVTLPAPAAAAGQPGAAMAQPGAAMAAANAGAAVAPKLTPIKAIAEINDLADQGREAERTGALATARTKYDEADRKIVQIGSVTGITQKQKDDLAALQKNIQDKLKSLSDLITKQRERRLAAQEALLGADQDVCWVTDLKALPGETYRYRVRIHAVNPHAGLLQKLKNPEDAAKVIQASAWSEWSDPASLPASKHLLFAGIDPSSEGAKVKLYQWTNGKWGWSPQTLSIGQPASWSINLQDYSYDGVVVALEPAEPYEQRTVDTKRKTIRYSQPRPTPAMVVVSADGSVEERLQWADTSLERALMEEKPAANTAVLTPSGSRSRVTPAPRPGNTETPRSEGPRIRRRSN